MDKLRHCQLSVGGGRLARICKRGVGGRVGGGELRGGGEVVALYVLRHRQLRARGVRLGVDLRWETQGNLRRMRGACVVGAPN